MYSPHLSVPILFLVLAGLCLTNATILLKLLLKPKLWSLVNLGLSVLLGIYHYPNQPTMLCIYWLCFSFKHNLWNNRTFPTFHLCK